jgi:hypothetical protein
VPAWPWGWGRAAGAGASRGSPRSSRHPSWRVWSATSACTPAGGWFGWTGLGCVELNVFRSSWIGRYIARCPTAGQWDATAAYDQGQHGRDDMWSRRAAGYRIGKLLLELRHSWRCLANVRYVFLQVAVVSALLAPVYVSRPSHCVLTRCHPPHGSPSIAQVH